MVADPKIKHFWISYADVLVKSDKLTDAKKIIKKAKKEDLMQKKLETLLSKSQSKGNIEGPSRVQVNTLIE